MYDSESYLTDEQDGHKADEKGSWPREKLLPPMEFETEDQILERVFKREYGMAEAAAEPMFNSWDDLLRVPQPYIPTMRQEPGIRAFQRKANKYHQNPILGRSGDFNYVG